MASMVILPVWDSQVAMTGRAAGSKGPGRGGIFGLGAAAPLTPAPGPTDVVVDSLPANCPDCPPTISCAPCPPTSCPKLPESLAKQVGWHFWGDPATGKTMCVRTRAPSEAMDVTPGYLAWIEAHAMVSAIIFGVGVLGIGACVAYSRRHG